MYNVNCLTGKRFISFIYILFCIVSFYTTAPVFAEGSKDLDVNGGSRAFMISTTQVTSSFLFPTLGTIKVYAKAGEIINVGSSVQGKGFGTINLKAPNGNTYTSGTSATVGLIADHDQEMAGPLPAAGGYTPYTRTVQANEEGVWEVNFISQNNGLSSENPLPVPSGTNWTQPTGEYIAAFDVTVMTAASAPLKGRVYTNIFSGTLGTYNVGFNGVFTILTKDGYQYTLDNNGQAGDNFSFFANNKGFRKSDGTASYLSIDNLNNPDIQDPRAPDTEADITYKIFFNTPSLDLPATAKIPGGGTTWLLDPLDAPSSDPTVLTNPKFTGIEGTPGKAGTSPLGGIFGYTVNRNGNYIINIDVDHDGLYTSAVDVSLSGNSALGQNSIAWNGLDGLNNKVPVGNYTASIKVVLFGAEVHFPFFDVERNINGIKLTRNNGVFSPNFDIYWDDTPITAVGKAPNPIKTLTPINSWLNGHKWGTAGSSEIDFGNDKGLDTWSFVSGDPISATVNFQVQEADLEITGVTPDNINGCVGQQVTYVIPVRNNGPNDVAGSKFSFSFPPELKEVAVTHATTAGTSSVISEAVGTAAYTVTLNLANGAATTFTVTGKVSAIPTAGTIDVTAAILRGADMTDPDATNPDAAIPSDPAVECDSAPSGAGCNNIKTNSLNFLAQPNAGPDQSVFQHDIATLKTTTPGTWAQVGAIPAVATITTPTDLTTTVTGLNDIGTYQFTRTNTNGCADMVTITVVPKSVDIPNIITPNGDGKNDTFNIPNIQLFPGTQLIIVNRWGNEVYRSNNYQNTWNGEGLSEGTYYYVLNKKEITGSVTTFKGWVFLKR